MKNFYTRLLSGFQNSHKRRQPARRDRQVRLSVETLERRELPSVSPLTIPLHTFNPNALSQGAHFNALIVHPGGINGPNQPPPKVVANNGPDLSGDTFNAVPPPGTTSTSTFQIVKMTAVAGSPRQYTFTGTWDSNPLMGTMTWSGAYYTIQFSWTGGHGHFHQFSGTIYAQKGNWSGQLQLSGQLIVDHDPTTARSLTFVHN